ncbi:hypothetical protein FRC11_013772, partial [Ceratobasidium sp. 423]
MPSKKNCFCCGKPLNPKTCWEHLKAYLLTLAGDNLDANPTPAPNPAPSSALDNDLKALLAADPDILLAAVAGLSQAQDNCLLTEVNPNVQTEAIDDMVEEPLPALGDASYNCHPPTPPLTPPFWPVHGLCQIPPVTVEDWPNIDPEDIPNPPNIEDEPMSSLNLNYGPEFVEHIGPLGSDATNEPLLTDEEICEIVEMELGNQFNDSEWVNM